VSTIVSDPTVFRVAGVQSEPAIGEKAKNLETILGRLHEAADGGASLVIFPECALTGYGFESRAEASELAETADGPASRLVSDACAKRGMYAVYGFLESDGDRLFNACLLTGPKGPIATYRKVHLPYLGVDRFVDPGDRPFAVHDTGGLRIGMIICYDGSFPEPSRVLTLLGADLLVLPTNWPTHSECAAEHMIATRAMENVVFMIAVNRVGEERGFRYIGHSSIAAPSGQILAAAGGDREETFYADIDPTRSREKRQVRVPGRHEINRIADRRPQFYGPIVEGNGRE
jgi:predicted amidohydrolase